MRGLDVLAFVSKFKYSYSSENDFIKYQHVGDNRKPNERTGK